MVLHLNYKTTHSSSVIQRQNSLLGELYSKILTNSLNDSKMKRLWLNQAPHSCEFLFVAIFNLKLEYFIANQLKNKLIMEL